MKLPSLDRADPLLTLSHLSPRKVDARKADLNKKHGKVEDRNALIVTLFFIVHSEVVPRKSLCHQEGEHEAGLRVDLDWLGILPDLPPGDGLVRPRAAVGSVKLGARVEEHAEICSVSLKLKVIKIKTQQIFNSLRTIKMPTYHEISITNVVLD